MVIWQTCLDGTNYKHTIQRYTQQSIIKYMMLGKIKEERVDDNEPVPQCIIFPGGQVI